MPPPYRCPFETQMTKGTRSLDAVNLPAESEPARGRGVTLPFWLVVLVLAFLFGPALKFDFRGGWFVSNVYGSDTSVANAQHYQLRTGSDLGQVLSKGKTVFGETCALCHHESGIGKPEQAPPLAGSEWVNAKGVNRLIRIPLLGLTGPIEVKGRSYNFSSGMTSLSGLSNEDIAAVLTYIRAAFGNKASPVTVEQVKRVRITLRSRSQAYSPDELKTLLE
jgi:mono/diheme cytochrome c family protein